MSERICTKEELEAAIDYSLSHFGLGSSVTKWEYAMAEEIAYLRRRINDMALGTETDEWAENRHPHGGIL